MPAWAPGRVAQLSSHILLKLHACKTDFLAVGTKKCGHFGSSHVGPVKHIYTTTFAFAALKADGEGEEKR